MPEGTRGQRLWRAAAWLVGTTLVLVAVGYGLVKGYQYAETLARHDVRGLKGDQRAVKLIDARKEARALLLQVATALLAVGAFFFTGRNFRLAQKQNDLSRRTLELGQSQAAEQSEANRQTLRLSEEGQVTDRFTRAIDQLGSEKIDVRLGGIYALERVSADSPRDRPAIMEVLAAFARRCSQPAENGVESYHPAEIQAAVSVIARRDTAGEQRPIDLRGARLTGMTLAGARLAGADLSDADLENADLSEADLTGATLRGTDLTGANLRAARLTGAVAPAARLSGAVLEHAVLERANLTYAVLTGGHLSDAHLTEADLTHAKLDGGELVRTTLTDAVLTHADLSGASLGDAHLNRARLPHANLSRALCPGTDFEGADLTGASMAGVDLSTARLPRAVLDGASLSGAVLDGADISHTDLRRVKFGGLDLTGAVVARDALLPEGWRVDEDGRVRSEAP